MISREINFYHKTELEYNLEKYLKIMLANKNELEIIYILLGK